MLVAERDALDDRTGSLVAQGMRQALQLDRTIAAGMVRTAERQLNERLASYRSELAARTVEETGSRLGRALLRCASGVEGLREAVPRAASVASRYLSEANEALLLAFGAPDLPADVAPSADRARLRR